MTSPLYPQGPRAQFPGSQHNWPPRPPAWHTPPGGPFRQQPGPQGQPPNGFGGGYGYGGHGGHGGGGPYQPPGQFRPRPPKQKAPGGFLTALGIAAVILVGLLAYGFFSGGSSDEASQHYENEDFTLPAATAEAPPLPFPQTERSVVTLLQDNPIYQTTIPEPVRCELDLDDTTASLPGTLLEARLTDFVACLTRVWGPSIEEAGYNAYQPQITVYPARATINTPCGTMESYNAFYCGMDQNLYVASDVTAILSPELQNHRVAYELIVAHEYGHAMQGRTGIFTSSGILQSRGEGDEAMEASRRAEVQADCFAGLALRSLTESLGVTDDDVRGMVRIADDIGDDTLALRFGGDPSEPGDHGTGDNRAIWTTRGYGTGDVGVCNTWTAPADEVR